MDEQQEKAAALAAAVEQFAAEAGDQLAGAAEKFAAAAEQIAQATGYSVARVREALERALRPEPPPTADLIPPQPPARVVPNRHDRRKAAALARREAKQRRTR